MSVSVSTTNNKKRVERKGIIIHTSSITLIEPADDGKITIYVDGAIGTIDGVTTEMTLGGPEGIVTKIGDDIVIRMTKKGRDGKKKQKQKGSSVNMFI